MVINTREVLVARVVGICGSVRCGAGSNVVVEIEGWLKGGGQSSEMQYRINAPAEALTGWKTRSSRLLLIGDSPGSGKAIDLSDPDLKVLTADMQVLRDPQQVLQAAQKAIDSHRNIYGMFTFTRHIPLEVAKAVGRGWDMTSDVPADSDLENWAQVALYSNEVLERAEAAAALGYFPSQLNAERLKPMLNDPALLANGPGNINYYFVRRNAYESLLRMGVREPAPMLQK
jgi:hypothetical protein